MHSSYRLHRVCFALLAAAGMCVGTRAQGQTGVAKADVFTAVGGTAVSALTGSAGYPNNPEWTEFVKFLEYPRGGDDGSAPPGNVMDNYGVRITGYITPKETASYVFYLASDDNSEFWLSTDDKAANLVKLANEPQWNPVRAFATADRRPGCAGAGGTAPCENVSDPISLTAGVKYYFQALMKEGGGGDNLAVGWAKDGDPAPTEPISGEFLSTAAPAIATQAYTKSLKFEAWFVGDGSAALPADLSILSTPPNYVGAMSNFDTRTVFPDDRHDKYLARISGWITPPATADYYFHTRSDDASELFISSNDTLPDPATDTPVAMETGCCKAYLPGDGTNPQTSAAIHLEGGKRYGVVAILKEGGGGDYLQVAASTTGAIAGLSPIPGAYLSSAGLPKLAVTGDPQSATVIENRAVSFSVGTTHAANITYQWQSAGTDGVFTDITGATSATYKLVPPLTANGNMYRVVVSSEGGQTSTSGAATLTVNKDPNPGPPLVDITQPTDQITASSNNSPGSEGVANVIDNGPAKYLNFDKVNTGFTVTPGVGRTVVSGLTLTSANDAADRDPSSYELSGSNDGGATFSLISSGAVPDFGGVRFKQVRVDFENFAPFTSYKLIFPTTAGNSTCCMQVSEVELLGRALARDVTQPSDLITASSNNSPGSEGVANVIDNGPAKYLNFDKVNTGFTVTPAVGSTILNGLTITSANDASDRDPKNYVLYGSNDAGANFDVIWQGDVPDFGGVRFKTVAVSFNNNKPYKTYKLIFPDTIGPSTCCMQVSEVEFLGTVAPQDVTQPGDPIVASSNNSPGSEGVGNVIDNGPAKYLNFDKVNTGFTVTPAVGKTVVVGMSFESANDAADRDPKNYILSGSNDGGTTFTVISQGDVPDFGGVRFQTVQVFFDNSTAYSKYKLIFPDTIGPSTCCMQIAEVELLGFSADSSALPKFKAQPQDAQVLLGASGHFSVVVNGPWQIQWFKNGKAIPGATQLTFDTPAVTAANENDAYYAVAKNGALVSQSDTAHLHIFTPSSSKSLAINFRGTGANGAPTDLNATDVAGVWQQAYWNNANGNSGTLATTDLTDSAGNPSDVTFEWDASASWGSGTGTDSGDRKVLNGYLDPQNGNAATLTFSGVPAGHHRVIVYAVNRPLAFNDADYSVVGLTASGVIHIRAQNADEYNASPGFVRGTSADATKRTVANYVEFDDVQPAADGTIIVTAQSFSEPGETPAGTAPVNGVQLVLNPPVAGVPPEITVQPVSKNTIPGGAADFSVTATGTATLKYEWRKDNVKLGNGGDVSGADTAHLHIANIDSSDAGAYSVAVSNGSGSVTSSSAVLSLYNGTIGDRMIAHYAFDEKAGTVAKNSSTGADDGQLNNYPDNTGWTAGKIGGALSFDGSSEFVVVPNYTKPTTQESISAWVNSAGANADATIAANTGIPTQEGHRLSQFEFREIGSDGDIGAVIAAGPNVYSVREGSDKALSLNEWHHVVMTADGAHLSLYRDGKLLNTVDYSGRITDATASCIGIGAMLDNVPDANNPDKVLCANVLDADPAYWTGMIDDLAIWTRTLGADEVAAIYNAGLAGKDVSTIPPVVSSTPPHLTITRTGGSVTISWDQPGFTLQSSSTVTGGWAPVAGVTGNSFTTTATGAAKFYRMVK